MKIVFLGTSGFGIPAIESLIASGHAIVGVVTTPGKPSGRGRTVCESAIACFAREHKLSPVLTPQRLDDSVFVNTVKSLGADCAVVVAFRLLPEALFALPPLGAINIHASLLPKYRGPAPIQRAIEAGEHQTGVTVFRIDRGIDTGNILLQEPLEIGPLETTPQLSERMANLGARLLVAALDCLKRGDCVYRKQDPSLATPAPKLFKAEAKLDWCKPARTLFNKIRAFKPFPGAFFILNNMRLTVEWAVPVDDQTPPPACGTICGVTGDHFDIQCAPGRLRVLVVKPEGKGAMDAAAFLRGHQLTEGTRCA
ncbi:MAG: methionyl-tRNA formyltransferase [Chitinivibrionales bacterium]|nr:methionyl-tRNA formyltransferase [Chitinivibrionales bacterium]